MGINWGDMMYPDNPKRRDEVNKLAASIQANTIAIYSNVRTVSKSLNQAYEGFQILPELDLNLTFKQCFDRIEDVMSQWKSTTEELKMNPEIPQSIKDLMVKFEKVTSVGELPQTVKDIVADPAYGSAADIGGIVVGLVAGTAMTYFIRLSMGSLVAVSWATISIAGVAGFLIGGGIGALAILIFGVIEGAIVGAKDRDELEALRKKYQAMDDDMRKYLSSLEDDVAAVQRAIIKALPDDA